MAHSIAAVGVEWAALTDHNSVSGQYQFRDVLERRGVHSVVGLEMDARYATGVLHLLSYGFDVDHQPLLDALRTIRQPWRSSAQYCLEKTRWLTRARSAAASSQEPGSEPSRKRPPHTDEAIDLLHQAGGLVFLAHPLAGIGSIENLRSILDWLQPQGLDGLEVFHKQYSEEIQQALLEVAEHRDLLTVAGSDFHGVHHSDGGTPGVDMPLIHWKAFIAAIDHGR